MQVVVLGIVLALYIVVMACRGHRALRWALDDFDADGFITEIRAVQPGAIIRRSTAPTRTVSPLPDVSSDRPRLELVAGDPS